MRREIVSMLTKGTRTMGVLEQNFIQEEAENKQSTKADAIVPVPKVDLLMALHVRQDKVVDGDDDGDADTSPDVTIGFCVVDASTGKPRP